MFEKIDGGDNVIKGQTSVRDNIQDVLCPFTDWYCIQGSNDSHSHSGSEANDIRGIQVGVRYPYFAPVDVKCVNIDKKYAFVWWQSVHKVRLADGSMLHFYVDMIILLIAMLVKWLNRVFKLEIWEMQETQKVFTVI